MDCHDKVVDCVEVVSRGKGSEFGLVRAPSPLDDR